MNTIYQVMNARYRTLSRFARRSQPRAGRTKRTIFLGSLRISPNSAHPHRMSLAQLKALEEQVREHLENYDIVILDADGQFVGADELFGAAPKEQSPKDVMDDIPEERKAEVKAALKRGDGGAVTAAHMESLIEKKDKEPEPEKAEPVSDPEPTPTADDEEEEPDPAPEAEEYDVTAVELSVAKLEEKLEDGYDIDHLEALLEAEKAGKNRKSAIVAIEDAIKFERGEE